jgi:RimK family alpha-L-glutamate ligase
MRIVIVGPSSGWHVAQLGAAIEARGHDWQAVAPTSLVVDAGERVRVRGSHGRTLHDCDAVLVRGIPRGSLEQIVFRVDALHVLAALGVHVVNTAVAIERTVDKQFASALVAARGLPTPRTIACERADEALASFDMLGGDVVVKPLFGSMGNGIVRIDQRDVAERVFRALELERPVFYVQRTVLGERRRDLRVLVLGGDVLGAIERVSDQLRANVARGATAIPATLDEGDAALAVAAAAAVGAELAGVDLIATAGAGTQVIEVNGIPGWQAFQRATGVDVAGALIDHVIATR